MLIKEIERLREMLNSMIESGNYAYSDILDVSQRLDILIVEYYTSKAWNLEGQCLGIEDQACTA